MRRLSNLFVVSAIAVLASGCDQLGIESASAVAARREADGKAVGGACRHAGRAIEDCYALNRKADRSAVYAGWREMNDYMRENKLEPVPPQIAGDTEVASKATPDREPAEPEAKDDGPQAPPKSKLKPGPPPRRPG